MTSDEKIEWIKAVPSEHKEAVLRATNVFVECLRDQLYEEHGEAGWRQRCLSVGQKYAQRFADKLAAKLRQP